MAAVTSLSFSTLGQSSERRVSVPSSRLFVTNFDAFRIRTSFSCDSAGVRASNSNSSMVIRCMSSGTGNAIYQTEGFTNDFFSSSEYTSMCPPFQETKLNFLNAYKRPIPSIYNTVLQELIVQQHLMRYKRTYCYDAVFALGFVTVYDQLMEGYPSDEDREAIFQAYIKALKEDPDQYRNDAKKLEEWARAQNASSLVNFSSREGEVEGILKDIAERAGGKGSFSYSRFFAIGLFRLLELANATEPTILEQALCLCWWHNLLETTLQDIVVLSTTEAEHMAVTNVAKEAVWLRRRISELGFKQDNVSLYCDSLSSVHLAKNQLCVALNINKRGVDRDLDVYRNLLSKLVQAKELLKEYVDREKKKMVERAESQKANEAITKCLGEPQYTER
ncbi:hypothetical protein HYC85_012118 [Camellia sinensis]|uniref:Uncharacterized protein n=1 Tax=Camellia sinensis TaxID=4442 RepID=A0A7J7HBX7_CAMSI|nr:hypothetical protein HYC85_012118 [Camellia sinensis]